MTRAQQKMVVTLTVVFTTLMIAYSHHIRNKFKVGDMATEANYIKGIGNFVDKEGEELSDEIKNVIATAMEKEGVFSSSKTMSPELKKELAFKLKSYRSKYQSPKALFNALRNNFSYEFGIWSSKQYSYESPQFDRESNSMNEVRIEPEADNSFKLTAGSWYVTAVRFKLKEQLPIKGGFEGVCCWKKLTKNPDDKIPHGLDILNPNSCDWQGSGGSSSSADGCFTKATRSIHHSLEEPGLYAVQFFFYPDGQMVKSLDGVLHSPIRFARVYSDALKKSVQKGAK